MASIMARRMVGRTTSSGLSGNHLFPGLSSSTSGVPLTRRKEEEEYEYDCTTTTHRQLWGRGHHHHHHHHHYQPYRLYHSTPKQEIVPLLAVAVVGGIGYYSYRALQRMDTEWEDYQWELQQYEKKYGPVHESSTTLQNLFPQGTVGIDIGTRHLVVAHKHSQNSSTGTSSNTNHEEQAQIVPTREGARYTYNGILYPPQDNDSSSEQQSQQSPPLVGKLAFEKAFYGTTNQVRFPTDRYDNHDNNDDQQYDITSSIIDITKPVLQEALETRIGTSSLEGVRPVVALPPLPPLSMNNNNNNNHVNNDKLESAFQSFLPSNTTTFVPEPVAAVWGAEVQSLLDVSSKDSGPVLVVDVGGSQTTCTVVHKYQIQASVTLPHTGGDLWIQTLVDSIVEEDNDEQSQYYQHDDMAQQRLYQAATMAIAELNTSTQVPIHIPYITMNMKTREAHHLETTISRGVLEQKVQQRLQHILKTELLVVRDDDSTTTATTTMFSPHVPPPTDYTSLYTSVLIQLLESTHMTPLTVKHVLLVGGGAKQPLIVSSLEQSWRTLTGQGSSSSSNADNNNNNNNNNVLVIPELAKRSDLVALGAASLPSHHEYDPQQGIVIP